jgi:hypothetical protein
LVLPNRSITSTPLNQDHRQIRHIVTPDDPQPFKAPNTSKPFSILPQCSNEASKQLAV